MGQLEAQQMQTMTFFHNRINSVYKTLTCNPLGGIVSRLGRSSSGSPDSMSSSYHGNTSSSISNDTNTLVEMSTSLIENVGARPNNIMVQSLDPTILRSPPSRPSDSNTRSAIVQMNDHQVRQSNPLASASKMVPVPESLMSPDCPPVAHKTMPAAANNKTAAVKATKGICAIGSIERSECKSHRNNSRFQNRNWHRRNL